MKNELIVARRTGQKRQNAESRLSEILHSLNLDELRSRFIRSATGDQTAHI